MLETESPVRLRDGACAPRNFLRARTPCTVAATTAIGVKASAEAPDPAAECRTYMDTSSPPLVRSSSTRPEYSLWRSSSTCSVPPTMESDQHIPRLATRDDADEIGELLHAFNSEFDTPSPGPSVLASRLRVLLADDETFAILAGTPAVAVALVTVRPNVWYEGRVALLDELYVVPRLRGHGVGSAVIGELLAACEARRVDLIEINVDEGDVDAQRFYERHGFSSTDPDSDERSVYFYKELPTAAG
jgi:GNAT superfamily N-acetyltransferase